jgi:hypothetical protein
MTRRRATLLCASGIAASACGYKVSGKADTIPKTVKTIAIPAFGNVTTRYKLANQLPASLTHEFNLRTRYHIVANPNEADAILQGTLTNFMSAPTVFDQATGRAAGVMVMVFMNLRLVERSTGKVLYDRQNFEYRDRYEVAINPVQYFEESETALTRLSQAVARQVVSSILEAW